MDLEAKVAELSLEATRNPSATRPGLSNTNATSLQMLHKLTGHRAPITSIAFHPTFSILYTASEDTTIKIWDFESGEFEQTLKGHTKTVQSVHCDPKGIHLGNVMRMKDVGFYRFNSVVLG